jgi:aspartate-semialdehyde dehydrogenase
MYSIGIIGATGLVGMEILLLLSNRKFPLSELRLYTTEKSVEEKKFIHNNIYGNLQLEIFNFEIAKKHNIIFIAVNNDFSKEWCKKLSNNGVIVIDNSSYFRYDADIPLVIPEINMHTINNHKLISNPNCTTAIILMALYPIHKQYKLKRVIISTYQSASGAGISGLEELKLGMKNIVNNEPVINNVFIHPLPYNIIPHIDTFTDNLYTKEEMKVNLEMKKILNENDILISCTAIRVPVLRSHSASITIETHKEINANDVRELLRNSVGISVIDNPMKNMYPMPLTATNKYDVEVGRIRENNIFGNFGLDLFVCGDQLLRGAALNAVIIAEELIKCKNILK